MSGRERRLVALVVLVAMLAGAWLLVVDPVAGGYVRRQDERRHLLSRLDRYERLIAAMDRWRSVAEGQAATVSRFALQAPTEALAVEALKERLVAVVEAEGGSVVAVRGLEPEDGAGGGAKEAKVRADLILSYEQLYGGLRRLAQGEPYVTVDYLSIAADRALVTGRLEPLDATVVVRVPLRLAPDGQGAPLAPAGRPAHG
jgi:hypothetical protein